MKWDSCISQELVDNLSCENITGATIYDPDFLALLLFHCAVAYNLILDFVICFLDMPQ